MLILLLLAVLLVFAFGYAAYNGSWTPAGQAMTINNVAVELVDVADTDLKRARGLSGRSGLAENEGMLFIFEHQRRPSFWMKDMHFPIDIIWIDENLTVVDITHSLSPDTFPRTYSPELPVKYVLEVNAGFAQKHAIVSGQHAQVSLDRP